LPAGSFSPLYFALLAFFSTHHLHGCCRETVFTVHDACLLLDGCRRRIDTKDRFMRDRHKKRRILMNDAKRKETETLLRRLITAADRDTKKPEPNTPRPLGNIQVIRRRKGSPDLHIA
jgi:hypothetical protein